MTFGIGGWEWTKDGPPPLEWLLTSNLIPARRLALSASLTEAWIFECWVVAAIWESLVW